MASSTHTLRKAVHSREQLVFREVMIAARVKSGLTQQALAERIGRPQSFVAKYEAGERRIEVTEFVAIVRAIGADPVRLLRAIIRRGV
jgi:transcriptional regulator with XRE-family HTH domain